MTMVNSPRQFETVHRETLRGPQDIANSELALAGKSSQETPMEIGEPSGIRTGQSHIHQADHAAPREPKMTLKVITADTSTLTVHVKKSKTVFQLKVCSNLSISTMLLFV